MKTSIYFFALLFPIFLFAQDPTLSIPEVISTNVESPDESPVHSTLLEALSYCDTPTGLYTSNITESSATFSWSDVWDAQSYSVQIRVPYGSWTYLPGSPYMNNSASAYDLEPGTTYEWRVRSNCAYGEHSYWSYPETFTTDGSSYCDVPDYLTTLNITQTTATLDWESVNGAWSYAVQWRYPNGSWHTLVNDWQNSYVNIGGLQPATTYEWRVRSNCSYGDYSDWSAVESFTTLGNSCHPPTELYTTNISESGATLNWSYVSGATSYSVQIRTGYGSWTYVQGSPFTGTWTNVYGLEPGTTYEWRVRSNCGYGTKSYWSYPETFTTDGAFDCHAPTELWTTYISESSATLNWSGVADAQSYAVQIRLPYGNWTYVPGSPFTNTHTTVYNLSPGTTYEWRVRSYCGYGNESYWSYPESFTTDGDFDCHAPYDLWTSNITETSATFNWSPVSSAQSYAVQIRHPYGNWTYVPGSPFTGTSTTVYNLTPGTQYEWRVRSYCGYGNESYWSYPESFTTLGSFDCHAPEILNTINITHTTATWDWSPVSGAHSYSVQWRYPNGNWNNLYGGPWTSTSLNVGGLQPGTTYEWRVRSNCGYGNYSPWSAGDVFTTLGSVCVKPTGLTTTNITDTSATLSWSPVSGAESYSVQIRYANGYWNYVDGSPFTDTTVTVDNLSPGTPYEWRVRSNCGYGYHSYWTSPAYFVTTGASSCAAPDSLWTTNVTDHHATLNWTDVAGAITYTIQWRHPNGQWFTLPTGPWPYNYLNLSGLNPNTTYEWRVRSNCGGGQISAWSEAESFTTSGGSGSGNDYCGNATLLAVNSTCINTAGTNVDASPSSPAPQGTCSSNGYKDVWFKFVMPNVSYPNVTIRTTAGTLTDAVMEIYIGNSCSSMSYLTCEDDNNNGNGSTMPVINLVGGPGITVWVRVWGKNGTTGTFDICVLDHESDDLVDGTHTSVIPAMGEDTPLEIATTPEEIAFEPIDPLVKEVSPSLQIAPNPVSDVLTITYQQTEESTVFGLALADMSGKIVLRKEYQRADITEFKEQLDVTGLMPGMYVLQMMTTTGMLSEKVMVVK